jgi:hypothetical protein
MTVQAFEPRKTSGFHPSIMKGAIAMSVDDFKPKKAPTRIAKGKKRTQKATELGQAKAWRAEMIEHFDSRGDDEESRERIQELRGMGNDKLISVYRFYLAAKKYAAVGTTTQNETPTKDEQLSAGGSQAGLETKEQNDLLERAQAWRDAEVAHIKGNPSFDEERAHADAKNLTWLESLSGEDLIWAHKVYTSAREKLALYQRAEEWRDDMLSPNIPQNEWLKSLAGMDSEQLAKEYQLFVDLWVTLEPKTEGETPETAGEQE